MNYNDIDLDDYLDLLINIEGLNKMANLISNKYWGMDIDIPININNRLSKTYGRFKFQYIRDHKNKVVGKKPVEIEISGKWLKKLTRRKSLIVLKHEVCHWACMKLGKPHSDGSIFFEEEIKRINKDLL